MDVLDTRVPEPETRDSESKAETEDEADEGSSSGRTEETSTDGLFTPEVDSPEDVNANLMNSV